MSGRFGHYVIVRACEPPWRGEWTNVGVLVYDSAGNLIAHQFDTLDRAVRRGSLPPSTTGRYADLSWVLQVCRTVDNVRRWMESTGHAMSSIQAREPLGVKLKVFGVDAVHHLYDEFVAEANWGR